MKPRARLGGRRPALPVWVEEMGTPYSREQQGGAEEQAGARGPGARPSPPLRSQPRPISPSTMASLTGSQVCPPPLPPVQTQRGPGKTQVRVQPTSQQTLPSSRVTQGTGRPEAWWASLPHRGELLFHHLLRTPPSALSPAPPRPSSSTRTLHLRAGLWDTGLAAPIPAGCRPALAAALPRGHQLVGAPAHPDAPCLKCPPPSASAPVVPPCLLPPQHKRRPGSLPRPACAP